MSVRVHLPTALRPYAGKQETVSLEGNTVEEILKALTGQYSQLNKHLIGEDGKLRNFVNVYLNDEDIRHIKGPQTPVKDGDTLLIVPSIAGGAPSAVRGQEAFSQEEIKRFSRHLIMPEVGMRGQKKLKNSRVLLIGAGGLGSPLGLYLAAAGVGSLGIVDFDVVDQTNLQRQIIHSTKDVGRPKLHSARERILGINPNIQVETYETRLTSENALEILKDYDVVVDGTDNFPTRYLVNDACVLLGKPNIYGSIFRFEGQASVFHATEGPCYRCLYPEPPPPGLVPSCAEGGVLGVLPGIIGTMQANETIKLLLGIGEPLIGRLLLFDALKMQFRELRLRKNPDCRICGKNPTIKELIDYEAFCGVTQLFDAQDQSEYSIIAEELKEKLESGEGVFILDVREPHEYEIVNIGGYLIPLGDLPNRVNELDSSQQIAVHCHHGARSQRAVEFLRELGFKKVKNLVGGIDEWAVKIDPSLPRY
jgi:molybdopterin/thiamine biosynthesis adenylyltransferase/rhodanese-related sulfurtransferase/molybdopterin converting factor small subunit